MIISMLLLPLLAFAKGPAPKANATCVLEWKADAKDYSSLSLMEGKKACEFPEGNRVDCAWFEAKRKKGGSATGTTNFRNGLKLEDYCTEKELDLFGASNEKQPKAFLRCKEGKAEKIILQAPQGKGSKECKLPNLG